MASRFTAAVNDLEKTIQESVVQLRQEIRRLEESADQSELWAEIDAQYGIPGVKRKALELRDRLEQLRKGNVILQWRPEVYDHDQELLAELNPPDILRAVVPPLDLDSFDDPDFVDFIEAQKLAAKKRQLRIQRIYMFKNDAELKQALAQPVIRRHLDDLLSSTRYMEVYTAVTRKSYQKDFVIFGSSRCSVSRGAIDTKKYDRLDVLYTSSPEKLKQCSEEWKNLIDIAVKYESSVL